MLEENERLFVYGTLRTNGSAFNLVKDARIIKEGIQISHYKMYSCGEYPIVEPSDDASDEIVGDILEIPKILFSHLDFYEDIENQEFDRVWDHKNAFYIYIKGINPPNLNTSIINGDWCKFLS